MVRLEEIVAGSALTGLIGAEVVEVVAARSYGPDAVEVTFKSASGLSQTIVYRHDESMLAFAQAARRFSFDGDGELFRLASEALRIRLAYLFDPFVAVRSSQIEALPHQLTAVYGEMLTRQPLRFLLADDPGAGKTVMAGLLIKELTIRGDLERCLIVAPGSLVEQWQDELLEKFGLHFEILSRDQIVASATGNVFAEKHRLLARLDMMSRSEELQGQLRASGDWDLIICDEAHRIAGKGGQPVIGLQTNFGGGKTHTLLALYHLAGAHAAGHNPAELSGLKPIFAELGIESLPEVRRAVFVGTDKGPSEAMYAADGREIRTLWGYLAHQLVGWDGVDAIAESERNRTNPGAEKMAAIMAAAAPCLILLDEVVAYAKQLQGTEQAAFHAFVQSLTEAAATVPGAVVVGSLPASRIEVGDELGVQALLRLEKLFGRIQSAWSAASELETFEIVRRRLFQPLDEEGEKVRDDTVAAFHKMYRDNPADFPPDVREAGYREQMRRAYPIHPEILKRFSEDWSTLPKFQRTRGVLKIMAHVVYSLWRSESPSPLITLGLMPVAESRVRSALLEPLDAAYDAIVQSEVDGELSVPAKIEAQRPRIGAVRGATRATRTVFLATAPHQGAVRGAISGAAIKLGAAQPGDQLSMFGEVLSTLSERAAYLYRDADRYWFSTQPTLNKLADERASFFSNDDADAEIISLLRKEQSHRDRFPRVHAAPENPTDVEDVRAVALVILPPKYPHANGGGASAAKDTARDVVERRGSGQRRYRNALIFVAIEQSNLDAARVIAKKALAWRQISQDPDMQATLTGAQKADAEKRARDAAEALGQRVRSGWCHILFPAPSQAPDGGPVAGFEIEHTSLQNRGGAKPIAQAVYDKARTSGHIVEELGAQTLLAQLQKVWPEDQPHIEVATILDWFASYTYLDRVRDDVTVTSAIEKLVGDLASPVAFAQSFDEASGTYDGVSASTSLFGAHLADGLLVWRSRLPETPAPEPEEPGQGVPEPGPGVDPTPEPPTSVGPRRFFGSIDLDPENPGRIVARIAENVLFELARDPKATLKLSLEIAGVAPAGYTSDVVDVVRSNLRDLKIDVGDAGFEEQ